MSYYPVFLDLSGKKVVVVGGGKVAQRKIETLLEYGAVIYVISKDLTPELQERVKNGNIMFLAHEFEEGYIEDAFLVIIATNDKMLNQRVSTLAKERNILVNTVDRPEECNFIVPSIVKRGDLLIAVSTSGKSPTLAKRIKEKLIDQFGKEYGDFLNMMGRIRKEVLLKDISEGERGRIFHELVDSSMLDLIKRQDFASVATELERMLKSPVTIDDVVEYLKDE